MEYSRQMDIFNPETFKTPVHIIGVGATGSWLALALAKLGITDITIWDFDTIEEHNLPNQAYRTTYTEVNMMGEGYNDKATDIGRLKVDALEDVVYDMSGTWVKPKAQRVTGTEKLTGIVFVMTDTMKSRKDIWGRALKYKMNVDLVIEPRMGLDVGRIYCVNPMDVLHVKNYEATLYTDEEAEVSACGTSQSVVATAMAMAGMCVWKLINWHNEEEIPNQTIVDFRYNSGILATVWKEEQ